MVPWILTWWSQGLARRRQQGESTDLWVLPLSQPDICLFRQQVPRGLISGVMWLYLYLSLLSAIKIMQILEITFWSSNWKDIVLWWNKCSIKNRGIWDQPGMDSSSSQWIPGGESQIAVGTTWKTPSSACPPCSLKFPAVLSYLLFSICRAIPD